MMRIQIRVDGEGETFLDAVTDDGVAPIVRLDFSVSHDEKLARGLIHDMAVSTNGAVAAVEERLAADEAEEKRS